MRQILILGAGKSATVLIQHLLEEAPQQSWIVHVADADIQAADHKINGHPYGKSYQLDLFNESLLNALITHADIVISMLPPAFHYPIALRCLQEKKHFLNASYVTNELRSLQHDVLNNGLLFLGEMGLDPGIDHMSAMSLINNIKEQGGQILSFRSHCGGLVAPESDDNPWHYKISWNPRNVLLAGKDGATYLLDGKIVNETYEELFQKIHSIDIPTIGTWAWYPNRDSMHYLELYGLSEVKTFIRTTLRHPLFMKAWSQFVSNGYTKEKPLINTKSIKYKDYFKKLFNNSDVFDKQLLYIGAFSDDYIDKGNMAPFEILQHMLEKKLVLNDEDRDMVVMLHEIHYKLNSNLKEEHSILIVKGVNNVNTAMAKTVGLPLAIATKLILNGVLKITGLHIPTHKSIYEPVLQELTSYGIDFKSTV